MPVSVTPSRTTLIIWGHFSVPSYTKVSSSVTTAPTMDLGLTVTCTFPVAVAYSGASGVNVHSALRLPALNMSVPSVHVKVPGTSSPVVGSFILPVIVLAFSG